MNFSRSFTRCGVLAASVTLALGSFGAACAANTAPAITAFDQAFAAINDYTCVLHVHEAKGTATQDRVYQYSFMKPHYAKTFNLTFSLRIVRHHDLAIAPIMASQQPH